MILASERRFSVASAGAEANNSVAILNAGLKGSLYLYTPTVELLNGEGRHGLRPLCQDAQAIPSEQAASAPAPDAGNNPTHMSGATKPVTQV